MCGGRVCNEDHEGRLNPLLEGIPTAFARIEDHARSGGLGEMTMEDDKSSEMSAGYSFFPGKISAVEGNISSGRTMRVARVH